MSDQPEGELLGAARWKFEPSRGTSARLRTFKLRFEQRVHPVFGVVVEIGKPAEAGSVWFWDG
jgi:hypothetical protein